MSGGSQALARLQNIVMAHIVMAYTVMDYIVMAHIVMAYIVMAMSGGSRARARLQK